MSSLNQKKKSDLFRDMDVGTTLTPLYSDLRLYGRTVTAEEKGL